MIEHSDFFINIARSSIMPNNCHINLTNIPRLINRHMSIYFITQDKQDRKARILILRDRLKTLHHRFSVAIFMNGDLFPFARDTIICIKCRIIYIIVIVSRMCGFSVLYYAYAINRVYNTSFILLREMLLGISTIFICNAIVQFFHL